MFKNYFVNEFGIPEEKIDYLPQYAIAEFDCIPERPQKDTTDFVFAGNVGTAQNLYVVLKAAHSIQSGKINDNGRKIYFHIVGEGQELDNLKNMCKITKLIMWSFMGGNPLKKCQSTMLLRMP